jgi:hypothetical protein
LAVDDASFDGSGIGLRSHGGIARRKAGDLRAGRPGRHDEHDGLDQVMEHDFYTRGEQLYAGRHSVLAR